MAPWPITTLVSCLPVLVLGMGTVLAHMLHADAAVDSPDSQDTGLVTAWSPDTSAGGQGGPDQDHGTDGWPDPLAAIRRPPRRERGEGHRAMAREPRQALPQMDQVRLIASRLAAAGKPMSRRALRSAGVSGANETLNALARRINSESKPDRGSEDGQDRSSAATQFWVPGIMIAADSKPTPHGRTARGRDHRRFGAGRARRGRCPAFTVASLAMGQAVSWH